MNTSFKTILAIIDRVTASVTSTNTLFQGAEGISAEDQQTLETWAGKSLDKIKTILAPIYGKRQIEFNPFPEKSDNPDSPPAFWKYDTNVVPDVFYSLENTPYGQVIIAATTIGVCHLVFFSGESTRVPSILQAEFPGSNLIKGKNIHLETALNYLHGQPTGQVQLHVKGAGDHLLIWQALVKVPAGKLISYGTLAKATQRMAQDIGAAMGDNRIALLIPCHRVIKSTGELGQYHWGAKRKQAIILKEAVL
jgi:O-6-methylguanine DNA methyltransferase